jgi:FAD:protein FMN transferase
MLPKALNACSRPTNWCCALACLAVSCATDLASRSQPLLGTFVVATVRSEHRAKADQAISAAFDEVRRLDAILSLHRPDSELVSVNAQAARHPVSVSDDLFKVLEKAQEIATATDGGFDITIRPLAELWGFISKQQRLPAPGEIEATLPRVKYKLVALDASRRTVHFLATNISIDLGGIAKGYIVDRAIEILRVRGFTNVLVRAGGDLRVSGKWNVQLEDPARKGRRRTILLRNAAISTSGDYENYLELDGKRYGHILNPRTGWPIEGIAACAVVAPTCIESDALATAFFVLGPDRALQHFSHKYPVRFMLSNDSIRASPQFP